MRKSTALGMPLALLLAWMTTGASSCGTATTSKPDSKQSDPSTSSSTSSSARVGDAITLDGNDDGMHVKVRVLGVVDPLSGGEFDTPDSGKRYVGVRLGLANTGTATYSDSPSNGAKIVTVSDEQADPTLLSDGPCSGSFASDTTIAPGAKRQGCIPFEVPAGQALKTFQFALDSGFGPKTGEWSLR